MANTTTNNITQKDLLNAGFKRMPEKDLKNGEGRKLIAYKATSSDVLLYSMRADNKFYYNMIINTDLEENYKNDYYNFIKDLQNNEKFINLDDKLFKGIKKDDLNDLFKELNEVNRELEKIIYFYFNQEEKKDTMNIKDFRNIVNIEESAKYWKPGFIVVEAYTKFNDKEKKDFFTIEKREIKKYIKDKFLKEGYSMEFYNGILFLYRESEEFKHYEAIFNIMPKDLF